MLENKNIYINYTNIMNPLILELLNSSNIKMDSGGSHCGGKYGGALGREELRKILKTHTVSSLKNETNLTIWKRMEKYQNIIKTMI